MKIILASKSPRRKELLSKICPEFEIRVSDIDETLDGTYTPEESVELLAVMKGAAVSAGALENELVISSDTLVELDGAALGKPEDEEDARRMLRALSGRAHNVHTGVCVHYKGKIYSGVKTSRVYFRELTKEEISDYVLSGEPMDKAGAYGIQGAAGKFVHRLEGDMDTVVGLSLELTEKLIKRALAE